MFCVLIWGNPDCLAGRSKRPHLSRRIHTGSRRNWLVCILLGCLVFPACKYSLSGANIAPDVKTLSIDQFQNNTAVALPSLGPLLTNTMRDKFITQTNLQNVPRQGDLQLSGTITGYDIDAIAVQQNEVAGQRKLTIRVQVKFENTRYPDKSWDKTFVQFSTFSAEQDIADQEDALNREIVDKIVQDVFNKALSNW